MMDRYIGRYLERYVGRVDRQIDAVRSVLIHAVHVGL